MCTLCSLPRQAPFDAPEAEQTQESIRSAPVVYPSGCAISDDARELLGSLLQKDPERRLSLQGVLDHPWLKAKTAAA